MPKLPKISKKDDSISGSYLKLEKSSNLDIAKDIGKNARVQTMKMARAMTVLVGS